MDYLNTVLSPNDVNTLLNILKNPQQHHGIYLWYGKGSNGKTMLSKVLEKTLPHIVCRLSIHDNCLDFSKDIFICEDVDFERISPILKSLFESKKVVICISGQGLDKVSSPGLSRRMTLVTFDHTLNDPSMNSKVERLSRELSSLIKC